MYTRQTSSASYRLRSPGSNAVGASAGEPVHFAVATFAAFISVDGGSYREPMAGQAGKLLH